VLIRFKANFVTRKMNPPM